MVLKMPILSLANFSPDASRSSSNFLVIFILINFLFFALPNTLFASLHQIQPDNVFSIGRLSYRVFLVSPKTNSLYVGARGHLFRLWLYNINDTSSTLFARRVLEVPAAERDECLRLGNSDRECDASIRMFFPKQNGHLLVCLSHAMKPQLGTIDGQNLGDVDEPAKTVIGICSQHDQLNTTAVFVESGNPEDLPSVYSGIRTGLSLENHLIYRPPLIKNGREVYPALRTSIYDSTWLNEPQFVGSFGINQYVYFFFRELVPDFQGHGRTVVSRVARICKSDLGGRQVLRQVWTSFVKARLNCSISGTQTPFYFDHIQSIVKVDRDHDQDGVSADFYGTFTTAESPFQASAICVFSLNAINQLFDTGLFLEQSAAGNSWIPTPPDQVPGNRPGTCMSDSRTLSDEELHFAKSHLLMANPVPSVEQPLIYRMNEPLTTVVADRRDAQTVVLFAMSPTRNSLLKVVHWSNERPGSRESGVAGQNARLLAVYRLPVKESVNAVALLPNEYLFIGQDSQVSQFRLSQCHLQESCERCALDPYCSWNIVRAECFAQETVHATAVGWITSNNGGGDSNAVAEKCRSYTRTVSMTLFPGDSAFLECPGMADEVDSGAAMRPAEMIVDWSVDGAQLIWQQSSHANFRQTIDGGLVLLNVTGAQSGDYRCSIDGSLVVEYAIRVDDENCVRPKTVQQFHSVQREWCRKLGDYKSSLHKWQNLYDASKDQTDCANAKSSTEETVPTKDDSSSKNAFF